MSAHSATLTPHQQRALFPKSNSAEGSFTVSVDSNAINVQTKEIVHDTTKHIYGITGRNAEAVNDTVREIYIQFADTTAAGTVFHLEDSEFTNTSVWFSVDTGLNKYAVRVITGTLVIQELSSQGIHISLACTGSTERTPSGKSHAMVINADLHTGTW